MTDKLTNLVKQLLAREPELYPDEEWEERFDVLIGKLSLPETAKDQDIHKKMIQAGLYLLNDSLDKSHTLSQDIHNSTGSYWHGIMHRMEGDYSNAKYWFHQVRSHPAYASIQQQAAAYLNGAANLSEVKHGVLRGKLDKLATGSAWDPYTMVDAVELQVTSLRDPEAERILKHIQWLEIKQLLSYCFEQADGGNPVEAAR